METFLKNRGQPLLYQYTNKETEITQITKHTLHSSMYWQHLAAILRVRDIEVYRYTLLSTETMLTLVTNAVK